MELFGISVMFLGYILAYGTATVVCGVALIRARRIEDPETRRGLVALFVGSGEALEDGNVRAARESLQTASKTADRMSEIVDDLAKPARHGQTLDSTDSLDVSAVAKEAWDGLETDGLDLSLRAEGCIDADAGRTHGLFESAFAFARHNDATVVNVTLGDDGFTITDDGTSLGRSDPEDFFAYGVSVPDAAAGMLLPNLRTLARTHGWEATIDTAYTEGIRLVVSGVDVRPVGDERSSNGQPA